MTRFIVKVIVLSAAATLLWWATTPWTGIATITLAKLLHTLAGYPAPHLLAELDDYYWFAPLFPPFMGLVLASHWITPTRRVAGLAFGLVAFFYLVALQIAVVYSPYLTLSAARAYLMSTQIGLNAIVVPVILWLIATGGPPQAWTLGATARPGSPGTQQPPPATARRPRAANFSSRGPTRIDPPVPRRHAVAAVALYTLVFCGLMTLPITIPAARTTPNLSAARRQVARAVAADQPAAAVRAIDAMFTAQSDNAALSYLQMQLYRELGDPDAADRVMPRALTTQRRRRAYHNLVK